MTQQNCSALEVRNIIIRKGVEQDYKQILELMKSFAVFQKTPEKVFITLEEMLQNKDLFQCFVASVANEIVAFASFFFAYYSWSGKAIYLDDLYVKDEYRQQNIGTKLLNTVVEYAREQQCKSIRWLVSRWNENAINFYRKMGAETEDTEMPCICKLV